MSQNISQHSLLSSETNDDVQGATNSTNSTQTYKLTTTPQIIQINDSRINFKAVCVVTSMDNTPFDILLTNQSSIDNGENLDYVHVTSGIYKIEFTFAKNISEMFFFVAKSDNEATIDVLVTIENHPVSKNITSQNALDFNPGINTPADNPYAHTNASQWATHMNKNFESNNRFKKWILIGLVVSLVMFGVYTFYDDIFKVKGQDKSDKSGDRSSKYPDDQPSTQFLKFKDKPYFMKPEKLTSGNGYTPGKNTAFEPTDDLSLSHPGSESGSGSDDVDLMKRLDDLCI